VLLSSHLLDQVQRICDRVALFETGRIVRTGSVAELAREVLGGGVTVDVEAQGEGLEAQLRGIAGVSAVQRIAGNHYRLTADRDVRPDAARAVVMGKGSLTRLSVEEPSLEAIYASVFQRKNGGEEVRDAA
jgi:ABC-2 type transport system ATP-binding protein